MCEITVKKTIVFAAIFCVTLLVFGQVPENVQDREACEYARKKGNAEVWRNYLEQFPEGMCVFEAKNELKILSESEAESRPELQKESVREKPEAEKQEKTEAEIKSPAESPTVKVTAITDKRCKYCNIEEILDKLRGIFPGLAPEVVDYSDDNGKDLYKKFTKSGFKMLPIVAFDQSVEQESTFDGIKQKLNKAVDWFVLNVGAKFDPTKEICDNGIDDTNNGKIDCEDSYCKEKPVCRKEIPARIDLFIESHNSKSIEMLDMMKDILWIFRKDKINFNVNYIAKENKNGKFDSSNGKAEVAEDVRQLCAAKHFPKDYMKYIWCRGGSVKSGNWKKCAEKINENALKKEQKAKIFTAIDKCVRNGEGAKMLRENIKTADGAGVSESASLMINNKFLSSYSYTINDIQREICEHNPRFKGCSKENMLSSLQWSRKSINGMNWSQAVDYCKNLQEGGKGEWRLPNIDELRFLIRSHSKTVVGGECGISEVNNCLASDCRNWDVCSKSIDKDKRQDSNTYNIFSKLGDEGRLWSSSSQSDKEDFAWDVNFSNGDIDSNDKNTSYFVRCVR